MRMKKKIPGNELPQFGRGAATVRGLFPSRWQAIGMLAVAVISDNGSGYAPGELERLFHSSITQDIGKNVGIDLSISRTIAQEQGGNLTVTSALNEGTRYTVEW